MTESDTPSIIVVSSYVPRRCGIATFTFDLSTAIAQTIHDRPIGRTHGIQVLAMNDPDSEYDYGSEVLGNIRQHYRSDYRSAADLINISKVDAVSLQHEYGLFGGKDGDYILELLERLRKPVVTTLHTILAEPSDGQHRILKRLGDLSGMLVVMADRAARILSDVYEIPSEKIQRIHHGVPDVPFGETDPFKERFGLSGRPMILTFGLLNPGKGIETMLDALARVVPDHPNLVYVVLGVTHPHVRRESGESYRFSLERRAVDLGIEKNVEFHDRYVSLDDLCEYLQACDIYTTPYRKKDQIVSGTLAYALACGNAIISTPYWHAQELLADGRGRLVEMDDVAGFAANLAELLANTDKRNAIRRRAYDYGRNMIWPQVAREYVEAFKVARVHYDRDKAAHALPSPGRMRMSLPEARLDHLHIMSDDTGILQHSIYGTPDRHHGYTTDDNARALIVAGMMGALFHDEHVLPRLHSYLSFLRYAFNPKTGRFRNFMAFDRSWLETDGSDDCQGRAVWALGHLISHSPNLPTRNHAADLFNRGVGSLESTKFPRSWALGILGLRYYLRTFPENEDIRNRLATLTTRLNNLYDATASEEWPWFEDLVTYDNARLPQAMIIAGLTLDDRATVERGLHSLEWLLKIQTAETGHISIIGNDGWFDRTGKRAGFDQQPLEVAALIGACKAAYRATDDKRWLAEMRRCFEWYLGRNDSGQLLIDFKTRGCYDGLLESGVNQNQGAESLLSWLLSLLIMYEMQTGDVVEAA